MSASRDVSPAAPGRRWRRIAVALALIATGVLVAVAVRRIGVERTAHALGSVRPAWVGATVALTVASFALRTESWFVILRAALPREPIGRTLTAQAGAIGALTSAVLPGRLGEASRTLIVARATSAPRRNVSVVVGTLFSQTLLNLLALAILAVATLVTTAIFRQHEAALALAAAAPVAVVAGVVVAPRALKRAARSRRRVGHLARHASRELSRARRGLSVFSAPRGAAHAVVAMLAGWAVHMAGCYTALLAFGLQHRASVGAAAAVLLAVNVTAVLPGLPANVGIFQAACVGVLAAYGVAAGRALAYGIVLQAVEVGTAIGLGAPALIATGVSWRDLRRATPDGDAQAGGSSADDPTPRGAA